MSTRDRVYEEIDPNADTWTENIDVKLTNLCACEQGLPIQLSASETCQRFCSTAKAEAAIYLDAQLNQEVLESVGLNTLYEWCTKDRTDEFGDVTSANSGCVLRATNSLSNTTEDLEAQVTVSSNQLVVDLPEGFRNNVNYQLILVENSSESISTSVQFLKVDPFTAASAEALSLVSVKKYECNVGYRVPDADAANYPPIPYRFGKSFYVSASNPEPLTANFIANFDMFCHVTFPTLDSPSQPRIGIQEMFPMFHPNDPKFWDIDKNDKPAIQEIIEAKTGETFAAGALFPTIKYQTSPMVQTTKTLGFMLNANLIIESGRSRCPQIADYNSSDKLYQALGEFFKINNQQYNLEPLYEAQRMPLNIFSGTVAYPEPAEEGFGKEIIYIRKSQIDTIWYTYAGPDLTTEVQLEQSGGNIAPGTDVYFKLRSNISEGNPLRVYKIQNFGGAEDSEIFTHDKRIGCVPAI